MYIYMLNSVQLIDNVFYPLYYRYVPFSLRSEWHKVYHNYATKYYENSKKNVMNPQTLIDIFNEEKDKLSVLKNLVDKFSEKIPKIMPMYDSDKEYTEKVKISLIDSMNKINNFINIRFDKLNNNMTENKVEVRNSVEHFNYSTEKKGNSILFIIFIIVIIVIFILLFIIDILFNHYNLF